MPVEMSSAEFEQHVAQALDLVPTELTDLIDNCVILVDEVPPETEPGLLGLYEGVPLTERDSTYSGMLPDVIHLYRQSILAVCDTAEQVRAEIEITVVHEIAHHFGIDDDHLDELGYG